MPGSVCPRSQSGDLDILQSSLAKPYESSSPLLSAFCPSETPDLHGKWHSAVSIWLASSASACYSADQLIAGMTNRRDRLPLGLVDPCPPFVARSPASTSSCQDDSHDSACSPYIFATFGPLCLGQVLGRLVIQCREHQARHLNLDLSDHSPQPLIDFLIYHVPILRPRAAPSQRCLLDAVELRSRQTQVMLHDVVYLS